MTEWGELLPLRDNSRSLRSPTVQPGACNLLILPGSLILPFPDSPKNETRSKEHEQKEDKQPSPTFALPTSYRESSPQESERDHNKNDSD